MSKLKLNQNYNAKVLGVTKSTEGVVTVKISIEGFENLPDRYMPRYNVNNAQGKSLWNSVKAEVKVNDTISVKFEKVSTSKGTQIVNCRIDLDDNWFEEAEEDSDVFEGLDD